MFHNVYFVKYTLYMTLKISVIKLN